MQYQGIDEQKVVNRGLVPLARELNLPLVATNDVHYLRQGDYQPHDILLCIGTGKTSTTRSACATPVTSSSSRPPSRWPRCSTGMTMR
jgi:DNA polymerase III alpha subunit